MSFLGITDQNRNCLDVANRLVHAADGNGSKAQGDGESN
jgi:hypothetical protein